MDERARLVTALEASNWRDLLNIAKQLPNWSRGAVEMIETGNGQIYAIDAQSSYAFVSYSGNLAFVDYIFTREEKRRQGLASRLLLAVEDACRRRGEGVVIMILVRKFDPIVEYFFRNRRYGEYRLQTDFLNKLIMP